MSSEYIVIRKDVARKTQNLNTAHLLDILEYYFSKGKTYNSKGERVVNLTKKNREWLAKDLNIEVCYINAFLDVLECRGLIEKDYEEDLQGEYKNKTYRIILKD